MHKKHQLTLLIVASVFAALFLNACAAPPSGPRIDNIPMYGQPGIPRPAFLQKADADFVASASRGFGGDRKFASKAWVDQAARFLGQRNFDYALRRLNQAWLLDASNYEVYWNFGRVMLEQDKFQEGIDFIGQAIQLCGDDYQLSGLQSDLGTAYSYLAESLSKKIPTDGSDAFAKANESFLKSVSLDPKNGNAWRRWSISLAMENRPVDAAEKFKRAQELGAAALPPALQKKIDEGLNKI